MPFDLLLKPQEAELLESQAAIEKAAHGEDVTKEFDVQGELELESLKDEELKRAHAAREARLRAFDPGI